MKLKHPALAEFTENVNLIYQLEILALTFSHASVSRPTKFVNP